MVILVLIVSKYWPWVFYVYVYMHYVIGSWLIRILHGCSITNLDASLDPLTVPVCGRSLMPYCHFDLEPTADYFAQRNAEDRGGFGLSGGTVDSTTTRVIQFNSCGVGIKNTKYVCLHVCMYTYNYSIIIILLYSYRYGLLV